jgi:small subunit ribosomal protein S16
LSVTIRLSRQGHSHSPFYRITVADSRRASTGKFLQHIGYYDPKQNPPIVKVDEASALQWMKNGAQPSDTVRALFSHQGLMEKLVDVKKGAAIADAKGKPNAWKVKKAKVHKVVKAEMVKAAEAAVAAKAAEDAAAAKAAADAKAAEAKAAEDAATAAAAEAPAA